MTIGAGVLGLAWASAGALAENDNAQDSARAYQIDLLADADSRSSLLQSDGSVGHDGHFFLQSADGTKRLKIGGYGQIRYMFNTRDAGPGVEDEASGFQIDRLRLVFAGKIDDIDFLIVPFSGNTGSVSLLDAWVKYKFGDSGWSIQAGQFKLPFWREWLVSERFNQPVERSDLTLVFASIYSQGVQLAWQGEKVRFNAAFSDGLRASNTGFTSTTEADIALTARGEFLLDGNWAQFADHTSLNNTESGLMVGVAGHFQTGEEGRSDERTIFQYTADLNYEGTNHNVLFAFVGRHTSDRPGGLDDAADFGVLLQGGWFPMAQTPLELFGRYAVLIPDGDSTGDDLFNSITFGANYYIAGHAAKFTVDTVVYLDATTDTVLDNFGPSTAANRLSSDDGGQVAIRAQFQFIF